MPTWDAKRTRERTRDMEHVGRRRGKDGGGGCGRRGGVKNVARPEERLFQSEQFDFNADPSVSR